MKINAADLQLIERLIGVTGVDVYVRADDHKLAIQVEFNNIRHYEVINEYMARNESKELILKRIAYHAKETLLSHRAGVQKCPWPDFVGNDIYEGDIIVHPAGMRGKVVFLPDEAYDHDQWRVDYGDGKLSRLGLQITEKGQAVVEK